ncbi:hypothetical protein AB0B28_18015 [Glycomyces sp. NPDC046736]|uniref:hypothetical protein n=1 Tax=Glycomyces sp. NPDC046736 TaxID=3155615 RepID=UPI0033C5EF75
MDVVAAFREKMPLEDFPGIPHTWVSTKPNRFARLIFLARPDGQALFQINAKPDTDWDDVGGFIRFAHAHIAKLAYAAPMVAVPGLALRRYRFDSAIAVLPAAADLTPAHDPEIDTRIYGLFPGWRCEVSMTESEGVANRRYRRELTVSDWTRQPKPFIALTYGFAVAGKRNVEHPEPFTTSLDDVESTLGRIREADSGWLECENWNGRRFRIESARGKGLTWDGEPIKPETVPERLRGFAIGGS